MRAGTRRPRRTRRIIEACYHAGALIPRHQNAACAATFPELENTFRSCRRLFTDATGVYSCRTRYRCFVLATKQRNNTHIEGPQPAPSLVSKVVSISLTLQPPIPAPLSSSQTRSPICRAPVGRLYDPSSQYQRAMLIPVALPDPLPHYPTYVANSGCNTPQMLSVKQPRTMSVGTLMVLHSFQNDHVVLLRTNCLKSAILGLTIQPQRRPNILPAPNFSATGKHVAILACSRHNDCQAQNTWLYAQSLDNLGSLVWLRDATDDILQQAFLCSLLHNPLASNGQGSAPSPVRLGVSSR